MEDVTSIPEVDAVKKAVSDLKAELNLAETRVAALRTALQYLAPELRSLGLFDADVTPPTVKRGRPRKKTTDVQPPITPGVQVHWSAPESAAE